MGQFASSVSLGYTSKVDPRTKHLPFCPRDEDVWRGLTNSLGATNFHVDVQYDEREEVCPSVATNNGKRQLTSLTVHYEEESADDIDCTAVLLSILQHQNLEHVEIESSVFENGGVPSRAFDTSLVCRALAANTSVQSLTLRGLICSNSSIAAVPFQFLHALEKNCCLSELLVHDSENDYTLGSCIWDEHLVDYDCAVKIRYLLWLNRFGRRELRDKTMGLVDIAKNLAAVNQAHYFADIPLLRSLLIDIDKIKESLSDVFVHLRCDERVETWTRATSGQHHIETTNILYGLLREAPDCWCGGTGANESKKKET